MTVWRQWVRLMDALIAHLLSTQTILEMFKVDKNAAMAVSFDYMMQTGYLFGGWHLAAVHLWRLIFSPAGRRFLPAKNRDDRVLSPSPNASRQCTRGRNFIARQSAGWVRGRLAIVNATMLSTPDLSDLNPAARVLSFQFRMFGLRTSLCGPVATIACFEDNSRVKEAVDDG